MHIPRFSASPITWVASLIFAPATRRHVSRHDPPCASFTRPIPDIHSLASRFIVYPIFLTFLPFIPFHRSFHGGAAIHAHAHTRARFISLRIENIGTIIPFVLRTALPTAVNAIESPSLAFGKSLPDYAIRFDRDQMSLIQPLVRLSERRYIIIAIPYLAKANLDHKQPTNSRHVYNIFMGHELKKFTLDSIRVLTGINCSKRLIEIPGNTVDNSARGVSYIRYRAYYIANRSISIAQRSYIHAYITTSLDARSLALSTSIRHA